MVYPADDSRIRLTFAIRELRALTEHMREHVERKKPIAAKAPPADEWQVELRLRIREVRIVAECVREHVERNKVLLTKMAARLQRKRLGSRACGCR